MVSRVSTASLHINTLRNVSNTSYELAKQQRQLSSGLKAQSYTELAGSVERISGFEEKLGKISNYISSNKIISTRLNAVSAALDNIEKIASEFASDLSLYNEVTDGSFDLESSATSKLQQIEDLLNISIGGKYLFAGSRTNTPPIGDIQAPVNTYGVADANYYVGDDNKTIGRVSDNFQLEYGVTANDPALQSLITGLRTALEGVRNGSNNVVRSGQELVTQSVREVSALRAKVNLDITTVENVNKQHSQLQIFWQQALSEDIDTDIAAVTVESSVNQTILQATFQSFASLSRLKLTDYLN